MKITTKILHLLWAAFWSWLLLWMLLTGGALPGYLRHDYFPVVLGVLAQVWVLVAIALFFERRWAWRGSVLFTVCSLLGTLYIAVETILYASRPVAGIFILEVSSTLLLPILVLAALMFSRHRFLKPHDKAA